MLVWLCFCGCILCFCGCVLCFRGGAFVARTAGGESLKCWRRLLEDSVGEGRCREALEKRVGMCCREVLEKRVVEKLRRVLYRSVVQKCWREVL